MMPASRRNQINAAWFASAIESINVGPERTTTGQCTPVALHPGDSGREHVCQRHRSDAGGPAMRWLREPPISPSHWAARNSKTPGYGGLPQRSRGVTNDMFFPNLSAPGSFAQLAAGYRSAHSVNKNDLKRAMAHVSVKSHANGVKNPKAHLRREISEDQAVNAPMIAEPIGLYDCCGVSDGAACAIVTRPEIAESLGKKDLVSIKALQLAVSNGTEVGHNSWDGSHLRTTRIAAQRAYDEAGVKDPREEISMTEVHDCFSITELVTMEDLGIVPEGTAVTNVLDGEFDAAGKVPCQIDGGLKCFGHPIGASGLRMLYEMYLQFEGRAGDRQLDNLKLGLTHNLGGFPASNVASISIVGRYKD